MRRKDRVALSLVTAVFFLLCHGILGASHALGHSGVPTDTSQSHEMPMEGHGSATSSHDATDDSSSGGGTGLMYAAVILASVLGALLLALVSWRLVTALPLLTPKHVVHSLRRAVAPCRGPTLIRLQVFRL